MVEYFTPEFAEKLADALNSDETFQKKAEGLDTSLLNVATDKGKAFLFSVENGKVTASEATEETESEFKFLAPYETWVKNHKGEATLEKLIMTGKVKMKGSIPKIMRLRDKLGRVDEVGQKIDAEY